MNKLWMAAAASLAAMLVAACTQPEPVVVVVTATPTPEERVDDNRLARSVASPTPSEQRQSFLPVTTTIFAGP